MESKSRDEYTQVFSEPWNMSDVILLVEGEQFNVHRGILAIWSPVFGRMFAADFKEKNAEDVPLPGKKAEEIRELLLVIYPTIMKPISEMNCYFLLALAEEYQMGKLKEKCEDYLLGMQENNMTCADLLVLSQKYLLERLLSKCVSEMRMMKLKEITEHNSYKEISDKNLFDIFIGRVEDLEKELIESKETVKTLQQKARQEHQKAKQHVKMVIELIGHHVMYKRNIPYPKRNYGFYDDSTDLYLKAICEDKANMGFQGTRCSCSSLSNLHSSLDGLHKLFT